MNINKWSINFAIGTAFALGMSSSVLAQGAWPSKPIKLVIGIPPGLQADVFARTYADKLSKTLGQPIVVENKPGAAGNLAQDSVAKSAADGYTLLYSVSNSFTTNPYVYAKLPFDADKDFMPVASTVEGGAYLVVNKDFPAKTLQEFINVVRANPGKYSFASYGIGGIPHLTMQMMLDRENLNMVHIPYRSGPLVDVVSGNVQAMIEPAGTAIPFVKDGRVRALASVGKKRQSATPEIPTIDELVKGVNGYSFHGIWAPAGTPREIVQRLGQEIAKLNRDPEIIEKVRTASAETMTMTPDEMKAVVKRESATWSEYLKTKDIKLD